MKRIAVVGGGFGGLSAAYDLAQSGWEVTIFESESKLGGLAGVFEISPGVFLEKFYHHWFTNDLNILGLVKELGLESSLSPKPTNTGLYFANSIFRLASPLDLLRFTPLSFFSRIRTGLMALLARRIDDFGELENISASDWIKKIAGEESYRVVWRPLLEGKFGPEAENVSAVWFWNKLKLRGASRGKSGREELYYINGGFKKLLDRLEQKLRELTVRIESGVAVQEIRQDGQKVLIKADDGAQLEKEFDAVLVTTPLPIYTKLLPALPESEKSKLLKIRYLGNICLVLVLNKSLSETYWLNIADPNFPFVGIIEHTNFDSKEHYGGNHIVYLSKYLPTSDPRYNFSTSELFEYSLPYIQKMFPDFSREQVIRSFSWKEPYSQPVIVKRYSEVIPPMKTPFSRIFLSTMAQVYPEDRGTSYAVRGGREAAKLINKELG